MVFCKTVFWLFLSNKTCTWFNIQNLTVHILYFIYRSLINQTDLEEQKDEVDAEGKHQSSVLQVVEVPGQETDSSLVVATEIDLLGRAPSGKDID